MEKELHQFITDKEIEDIRMVIQIAEQHGFGNLIAVLRKEWADKLLKEIPKLDLKNWDKLCKEADAEMKTANGHSFMINGFKTRCQYCGRSRNQKGKCRAWLNTYMDILYFKVDKFIKSINPKII